MSDFVKAIKNKNRTKNAIKKHNEDELNRLNRTMQFKVLLKDKISIISEILDNSDVKDIIIEIDSNYLDIFNELCYQADMMDYNIAQLNEANKFRISKKRISF